MVVLTKQRKNLFPFTKPKKILQRTLKNDKNKPPEEAELIEKNERRLKMVD